MIEDLNERPGLGKEAERIPDIIGTITAYRIWKYQFLKGGEVRFKSTNIADSFWNAPPEPTRARHAFAGGFYTSMEPHEAPYPKCPCGLYGLKDVKRLVTLNEELVGLKGIVAGKVEFWGQVIEHDDGYRAEYGKIVGVYDGLSLGTPDLPKRLSARYGIELLIPPDSVYQYTTFHREKFQRGVEVEGKWWGKTFRGYVLGTWGSWATVSIPWQKGSPPVASRQVEVMMHKLRVVEE